MGVFGALSASSPLKQAREEDQVWEGRGGGSADPNDRFGMRAQVGLVDGRGHGGAHLGDGLVEPRDLLCRGGHVQPFAALRIAMLLGEEVITW